MAYPLSLADTVGKMATQITVSLDYWDVIVNYSEPAINNLLAETFKDASKKQIKDLKFDISVHVPGAGNIPVHYDLALAAPLMSFNSRGSKGPTCDLSFPITGGTVKAGTETDNVPPGLYTLVFGTLFLATATGAEDPDTKSCDQPFVFDDGKDGEQGCVVIDLPASKDITIRLLIDKSSTAKHVENIDDYIPFITAAITKQLQNDGVYKHIRYEIARVSSHSPPAGSVQLKPKSFRFDAFLPSEVEKPEDVGVLTLFIKTSASNEQPPSNLFTAWEALWRTQLVCSPIPKGETASIIFSKAMVYESMIKPALESQKFTGGNLKKTKGSLEVQIETHKSIHRDKFEYTIAADALGSTGYSADAVNVVLPPLTLTLKEDSGSATYATSWEYTYSCGWVYHDSGPSGPWGSIQDHKTTGVTTAIHTMPKDPNKHSKVVTLLDDYSFKMDCSVSKDDWKVTFKAADQTAWDKFWNGKQTVPNWMKGLDVDLPHFDLHLGSIDFFLTTNLLFPGDKQVIDIDRTAGLHIPADLYLVGKVRTK